MKFENYNKQTTNKKIHKINKKNTQQINEQKGQERIPYHQLNNFNNVIFDHLEQTRLSWDSEMRTQWNKEGKRKRKSINLN
jgi:hypothetical protein